MNALLADPDQVNVAQPAAGRPHRALRGLPARPAARHRGPAADQHLRRRPGRARRAAGPARCGVGQGRRERGGRTGPHRIAGTWTAPAHDVLDEGTYESGFPGDHSGYPGDDSGFSEDHSGYPGDHSGFPGDHAVAADAGQERHDRHDPGPAVPRTLAIPAPAPAPDHALDMSPRGYDGRPAPDPAPADPDPDFGATRRRLSSVRRPHFEVRLPDAHLPDAHPHETPDPAPADRSGPVVLPPAPPAVDNAARPRLPRRRKQTHLVPELRGDPILPSATPRTGPEPEHDPGLMAAFRRGFSLGDDSYAEDTAGGHGIIPAQGGDPSSPAGNDLLYDRDHDAPMARPRGDDRNHGE